MASHACRSQLVRILHRKQCRLCSGLKVSLRLVISTQPLALRRHNSIGIRRTICARATSFRLQFRSMIAVANRLKSNGRRLLGSWKKTWWVSVERVIFNGCPWERRKDPPPIFSLLTRCDVGWGEKSNVDDGAINMIFCYLSAYVHVTRHFAPSRTRRVAMLNFISLRRRIASRCFYQM